MTMEQDDVVARVLGAGRRLVFVGGLHRSGTTPLARALGRHPWVSGLRGTGVHEDEGQHLQDVYPPARAYGGPGRFAFAADAHRTGESPPATEAGAARLLECWAPYWDLGRPVLVEKSPPNLLAARWLQALFPEARFLMIVRHPGVVALSTRKWARRRTLRSLLAHWLHAHTLFEADAPHLRRLLVVRYEHLLAAPEEALAEVAAFLDVPGEIPSGTIDPGRNIRYHYDWRKLAATDNAWRALAFRRLVRDLEPAVNRFGYSLTDLDRADHRPLSWHA